jgi:hypothetical protein
LVVKKLRLDSLLLTLDSFHLTLDFDNLRLRILIINLEF